MWTVQFWESSNFHCLTSRGHALLLRPAKEGQRKDGKEKGACKLLRFQSMLRAFLNEGGNRSGRKGGSATSGTHYSAVAWLKAWREFSGDIECRKECFFWAYSSDKTLWTPIISLNQLTTITRFETLRSTQDIAQEQTADCSWMYSHTHTKHKSKTKSIHMDTISGLSGLSLAQCCLSHRHKC